MGRKADYWKKAAFLVIGLAVAGSTVYALVLRNTAAPTIDTTAVEAPLHATSVALTPRVEPRTWGRLVMVDHPKPAPGPGFNVVIRTPPLVINADPQPVKTHKVASAKAPAAVTEAVASPGKLEGTGGVMARFKAPAAEKPQDEGLPPAPDRTQIAGVMGSVSDEIQRCYDRGMVPGQVDLVLTVAGDTGRVERASVSANSSTATCIQRVAQTLRFPRFAKDRITIRYPYRFR
jgi:hypothetical protein